MSATRRRYAWLLVLTTGAGGAAFVAVVALFILFGSPNGVTFGAILWFACVSAVVTSAGVVQKRSAIDRPRLVVIGALVAVVFLLVPLWAPALDAAGSRSSSSYSGTVASDESSGFSLQDHPGVEHHSLTLEGGDRVQIAIDGKAGWEIQPPDGDTVSGVAGGPHPEAVTVSDGVVSYTANETGTHTVSVFAEPYSKASYRVSIEEAAG
ncbi:hypothetical protein [Haloarcula onubensis]|uniref:Uncharacterized protein n=1 Tax=Haloarcula onubensis TaxID=2950539 RepID=A0ABU2FSI4_9EURY|nr:hypothetical protein [Halomicroarcula sp. S3CR25-11]MDS0283247.1 hypothetical protein [Halomicroarcula sp. S3CR25-11]